MAYIRRPLLNMKHFSNVTLMAQERLDGDGFVWLAQLRLLNHKFLTTSHQKSRSLIMANGYWWVAAKRKPSTPFLPGTSEPAQYGYGEFLRIENRDASRRNGRPEI